MAILTGWAIAIGTTGADHTYVTSSDGHAWPCWGRSAGGHSICAAGGASARANCLSQSNSHAGIVYAISGVCHQTANRILHPANVIVSAAGGYWASVLLYGTYGTNGLAWLIEWEIRKKRCAGISGDLVADTKVLSFSDQETGEAMPEDPALQNYLEKVNQLYSARVKVMAFTDVDEEEKTDLLGQELELMVDYRLGAAAPDIASLRDAQMKTLAEKGVLDQKLISKELTTMEYVQEVNSLVNHLLGHSIELLGEKNYRQLFGVVPGESVELIDRDILAQYQ